MLSRITLLLFLFVLSLSAEPNIAQIKTAVTQNPALLDTPQAQVEMAKRGISKAEITQKLQTQSVEVTPDKSATQTVENNIESTSINDTGAKMDESADKTIVNQLNKRVNPFAFSEKISFKDKQQELIRNNLSRYSQRFYSNKNTIDSSSMPTPDDYIISTGDMVSIQVYGDKNEYYSLKVENDGTINLAFIGPVNIGGMTFEKAKKYLLQNLKDHYRTSEFNINMSKYSTIQVTLVGEVKHPGLYNIPSLSTVKDLLVVAQGVNKNASVRDILVKRNSKIIAHIDFYKLLFGGEEYGKVLLKQGDIVVIKQAKKLVSIDGYVKDTAIFELTNSDTLDTLIKYAGGMQPNASKNNIKIKRYSKNSEIENLTVTYKNAKQISLQDGDKVYIYPMDFSAQKSVNIYGNIIRPGSYELSDDMTLNSLLKRNVKNGLKKFFLPYTDFEYGVIKRYAKDLSYKTESFNLLQVLDGIKQIKLKPQDQVFIFNRHDIYANAYVVTKGKLLIHPGKLQYFSGMTIQDAINASGIKPVADNNASVTDNRISILDDKVKVTTYNTKDYMPQTKFYSLKNDTNVTLSPYDEVEVYDYYAKHQLEPISIKGEVVKPTTVYYEKGMTLKKLLDVAGGLTPMSYLNKIEIVRYFIDKSASRSKKIINLDLKKIDISTYKLQAYDEVTVYKIPNWNERKTVEIQGEVKFPGVYTISNGEKLSSVIKRAGGFTDEAFIEGAVFTRASVQKRQIQQYNESLAKIKRDLAIYSSMPANAKNAVAGVQASSVLNEVILDAKKYQPIGRVSIELDANLTTFAKSEYNLVLKDNDTLTIPSSIDTVTVFGEVFNPTSFVYNSDKSVDDYIQMASGFSRSADTSRVYVIHADGTSEPVENGWLSSDSKIKKGDTVVVPIYIKEYDSLDVWSTVSKIFSSFALTAASIHTLGAI